MRIKPLPENAIEFLNIVIGKGAHGYVKEGLC